MYIWKSWSQKKSNKYNIFQWKVGKRSWMSNSSQSAAWWSIGTCQEKCKNKIDSETKPNQTKPNQTRSWREYFNHLRLATNSFLGTSTSSLVLTDRTLNQVMSRVTYCPKQTPCFCSWDSVIKMVLVERLKFHTVQLRIIHLHHSLGNFRFPKHHCQGNSWWEVITIWLNHSAPLPCSSQYWRR